MTSPVPVLGRRRRKTADALCAPKKRHFFDRPLLTKHAFRIWSGAVSPDDASRYTGYVHRVHFSDMEIEAADSSFLGGADVSEISLANVNIRVVRDPLVCRDAKTVETPMLWGRGYMPEALTVRNVRNFNTTDVRITGE